MWHKWLFLNVGCGCLVILVECVPFAAEVCGLSFEGPLDFPFSWEMRANVGLFEM